MSEGPIAADSAASGPRPSPRGRRAVRWILTSMALLGLLAGLGVWRAFHVADETIAAHRARLPAERAAILALPRDGPPLLEPVTPGEATAVIRAFLAAVDAVPRGERERLQPNATGPVPPESEDEVLRAHPQPLDTIATLLTVVSSPPPPQVDLESVAMDVARWQEGARWLKAATDRAAARGDAREARRIALLEVAYGHEVARSGSLLASLVGLGIEQVGFRGLADAFASGPITAEDAHRMGIVLDRLEASRPALTLPLAIERTVFRSALTHLEGDELMLTGRVRRPDDLGWRHLWSWRIYRAEALDEFDGALDAMTEAIQGADSAAAVSVARATRVVEHDNAYVRELLATWPLWVVRHESGRARSLATRVALAVAEATARHGSPPASLAALVPEFLSSAPMDPWSGQPLRYADGKVWSVGRDAKDDGGTPPADSDTTESGDIVVTVPPPR